MELFMQEFFAYRSMIEKRVQFQQKWENFSLFWRLKGLAEEEVKKALPSFKDLLKAVNHDPAAWDRLIFRFKAQFLTTYYPILYDEEYQRQLNKIGGGYGDICDYWEREANKATIAILEQQAVNDVKPRIP